MYLSNKSAETEDQTIAEEELPHYNLRNRRVDIVNIRSTEVNFPAISRSLNSIGFGTLSSKANEQTLYSGFRGFHPGDITVPKRLPIAHLVPEGDAENLDIPKYIIYDKSGKMICTKKSTPELENIYI